LHDLKVCGEKEPGIMNKKPNSHLSANLRQILAKLAKIANLDYFRQYIGHTNAIYLLVYVAGLILCPNNPAMTSIADALKLCRHDSLQRMLFAMNLPMRVLSGFFIRWIQKNRGIPGWVILDDLHIPKEYSKSIDCAGYAYSTILKRSVMGIHIVTLYWSNGWIKIPVGFRLWLPREKTNHYRTKVDLAIELLTHNEDFCKSCQYVTFDSWYCTNRLLRICALMNLAFCSRLKKNRRVIFKKQEIPASSLPKGLHKVWLKGFGDVLVYCDTSGEQPRWLVSSDTLISAKEMKRRYDSRWVIEESHRFMKQRLGLCGCQCRRNTAIRNHISLVLLAHFCMEVLSARVLFGVYGMTHRFVKKFHGIDDDFPEINERKEFLQHVA